MRVKQSFRNSTDSFQFITLELSTSRYRLAPGEELVLHYDPADEGKPLVVEFGTNGELFIWTSEEEMFHTDGRAATKNYDGV